MRKYSHGPLAVQLDAQLLAREAGKRSGVSNLLLPCPLCLCAGTRMIQDSEMSPIPRDCLSAELFHGTFVRVDAFKRRKSNTAQRYNEDWVYEIDCSAQESGAVADLSCRRLVIVPTSVAGVAKNCIGDEYRRAVPFHRLQQSLESHTCPILGQRNTRQLRSEPPWCLCYKQRFCAPISVEVAEDTAGFSHPRTKRAVLSFRNEGFPGHNYRLKAGLYQHGDEIARIRARKPATLESRLEL